MWFIYIGRGQAEEFTLKVNYKKETFESLSGREWLNLELGKTPKILDI